MPYTYNKTSSGHYAVYHKNADGSRGSKVGETHKPGKENLDRYLAALHMHENKKKIKKIIAVLKKNGIINEEAIKTYLNKKIPNKKLMEKTEIKEAVKKTPIVDKKAAPKKVLKESVWHSVMELWNSTKPFGNGDASDGGINMTVGETFRTFVGFVLGVGTLTVVHYSWNQIVAAIKKVPGKVKQILQGAKIIQSSSSAAEAEQKLQSEMGVTLKESIKKFKINMLVEKIEKETGKKVMFEKKDKIEKEVEEAETSGEEPKDKKAKKEFKKDEKKAVKLENKMTRAEQIKEIKQLVEAIEKQTGKKVIFKEADAAKASYDGVKTTSPDKALENWASAHKFPKGEKTKQTVQSIMSHLKDSGFSIVKTPATETTPSKSSGGGLKEASNVISMKPVVTKK